MRSTSCGLTAPMCSLSPTSTWSPSSNSRRARLETAYAISSLPSSGTMTSLRVLSVSSTRSRPATSAIGATPLGARLEQLHDAGQAVGDVLTRDTTGVEGAHRQLRARLADGLGGDDADRLTDVDGLAGGQRAAVAGRAGADLAVAGQDAADLDRLDAGLDQRADVDVAQVGTGLEDRLAVLLDVRSELPGVDAGLDVGVADEHALGVAGADGHDHATLGAAVLLADDHVLRDVDQTTREVAGVRRTE